MSITEIVCTGASGTQQALHSRQHLPCRAAAGRAHSPAPAGRNSRPAKHHKLLRCSMQVQPCCGSINVMPASESTVLARYIQISSFACKLICSSCTSAGIMLACMLIGSIKEIAHLSQLHSWTPMCYTTTILAAGYVGPYGKMSMSAIAWTCEVTVVMCQTTQGSVMCNNGHSIGHSV